MPINMEKLKNFNLSFLRSKEIVGVDIGSSNIKYMSLKGTQGKFTVAGWGITSLKAEGTTEASPEEKKAAITKVLKEVAKKNGFSGKKISTSVSGNSVIVRYVKFPKLSLDDLKRSIQFEAEPYIPFDIRDVNISFHVIGDVVDEGQKKMQTILVAAKKDIVQLKIDVIKAAGLKPAVIDVDSFALENAYEDTCDSDKKETVLLVNIGANVTNMAIIENGTSKVVRDVFIAGNSITKILQKNLQCSFQEAEEIKMKFGVLVTVEDKDKALAEDNKEAMQISNIVVPVLKDLLSEIQRSLDFYLSQSSDRTISRVLVSGGTAKLKNINKYLAQELKMVVELFNPFEKIKGAEQIPAGTACDFAIACGLAMRKLGDSVS